MKKYAIIHFQPIELYPPVQNLITTLSNEKVPFKLKVYTTSTDLTVNKIESSSKNIEIIRPGKSGNHLSIFERTINYITFYLGTFFDLILYGPRKILYFESLSSFPAYCYKRFINSGVSVLVHYHEYTPPKDYVSGMYLLKIFFKYEKWLYPTISWLSHTNEYRMNQFLKDISPLQIKNHHILPNYPPKSWYQPARDKIEYPIKIVCIGAISLDTMYTKEFAKWVLDQNGNVTWDIYSLIITEEAKAYLSSLNPAIIKLHPGVNYSSIPELLKNYDIGVITYNGHIPSIVYAASNKLFEYYVCGLDVWFPDVMKGSSEYINHATIPKIVSIDFTKLNEIDIDSLVDRSGLYSAQVNYFCEDSLQELITEFIIK